MDQLIATKLYIPSPRPKVVLRPRLIEQLNEGLQRKLTLISASAGFGKTTLVSEWVTDCGRSVAWLSLEKGDSDPARFLGYLIAALQTILSGIGEGGLVVLQTSQPPPTEAILTNLLNEIAALPDKFILVLDDYHTIDSKAVDHALAFLLEHMPAQMHLVIATREDPNLPLARNRASGQLTELRAADLRFTPAEAAEFLNQVMGLNLSAEEINALEIRTEGWIAGLQLAAVSMKGHRDTTSFIKTFTGSHHFVLDYLVEEVLGQQPENIQTFLLCTSILDQLCGPLCDAVLLDPSASGQKTLEYLERANLFIVPLDSERRWYRYHHLFDDLLRQRLLQQLHESAATPASDETRGMAELHIRASAWYEDNGLEIEAFHHAVSANDVERAARLVEGKGMPLQFRGAITPVLNWLESLPTKVLDAKPSLWVMYASALSMTGQLTAVEQKLQAAEDALQGAEPDEKTRNLIGHIAAIRALLAAVRNQPEAIITQSRRALEYLHPDNQAVRTATIWKLGIAYHLQGDRAAASQAYTEAISISQASNNLIINMAATTGLGQIQESENQLYLAAETYQRVLQLAGDQLQPSASEAYLGLARIFYEWNDLDAAQHYGQQSIQLAQPLVNTERFVPYEIFHARLKLAQGDIAEATTILAQADQSARQQNFAQWIPDIAAVQVLAMLRQNNLAAAATLAQTYELPTSQALVYLAQGDPSAALGVLAQWRQQIEARGWKDDWLKALVLQAVALHAYGDKDEAVQVLGEALRLAEPGGFIRLFVDEGEPIRSLILDFRHVLSEAEGLMIEKQSRGQDHKLISYVDNLMAAFTREAAMPQSKISTQKSTMMEPGVRPAKDMLVEPLSERELEVLKLLRSELSGPEIAQQLIVSLNTLRTHTKNIYNKLGVNNRRAAIRRAEELDLF